VRTTYCTIAAVGSNRLRGPLRLFTGRELRLARLMWSVLSAIGGSGMTSRTCASRRPRSPPWHPKSLFSATPDGVWPISKVRGESCGWQVRAIILPTSPGLAPL
jgi:hypothetical protein